MSTGSGEPPSVSSADVAQPRRGRVLVVDDEPRIAQFLDRALRADGFEVVVAEDALVGSFLATSEPFDAVVLDISIPGGASGIDVLEEIRRRTPAVPVIMLSAHDDPHVRRRCLDAGAARFVAKPLVLEDLRAALREQVARPRRASG